MHEVKCGRPVPIIYNWGLKKEKLPPVKERDSPGDQSFQVTFTEESGREGHGFFRVIFRKA